MGARIAATLEVDFGRDAPGMVIFGDAPEPDPVSSGLQRAPLGPRAMLRLAIGSNLVRRADAYDRKGRECENAREPHEPLGRSG